MSRQSIQQHLQQQQQQQQQQLLNAKPQLQQVPLQFQQQNLRSFVKQYELGMCVRRLTHYMYQLRHRPKDNNIEFWREFVAEYFAPHAKKKWCVSTHESGQNIGVFQKDALHCEICNSNPGRGLEATVEVLPRLFKIQYECGTLEELLFVDVPHEYQNLNGQIIMEYATAIQESVFDDLRVVCNGQLRVVFSPDLKICSWEFCARNYQELIPRCSVVAQVKQIRAAAPDYQTTTDNALSNVSVQELQNSYNTLVASARQAAEAVGVPQVNALGHKRRYTRCLRIADVVSSMKDLIDYSLETGTGPMG